ncbi:hypothetical protein BDE02_10G027400 [Populus trichocarpa]|nr:hypothetical protein BDE02_10G027400 [Populus trichocarpa]
MSCRIVDAHCCRICLCTLLLNLPVVYYVQSLTIHRPDLSSAPAADLVDAANLISTAEFNTVPSRHSSTVSSSLEQSIIQVSSSRQHTVALAVACCRTHMLLIFATVMRAVTP